MRYLIVFGLLVLAVTPLHAEEGAWWEVWRAAEGPVRAVAEQSPLFSAREKELIRAYFADRHRAGEDRYGYDDDERDHAKKPKKMKRLPPGLQKKLARGGELPPGWQKKVARGEVLDPELYARSEYLPPGLRDRLPPGPAGTEVRRVEGKVVRILDATREIIDVLDL